LSRRVPRTKISPDMGSRWPDIGSRYATVKIVHRSLADPLCCPLWGPHFGCRLEHCVCLSNVVTSFAKLTHLTPWFGNCVFLQLMCILVLGLALDGEADGSSIGRLGQDLRRARLILPKGAEGRMTSNNLCCRCNEAAGIAQ
jgi:hypothetical protein